MGECEDGERYGYDNTLDPSDKESVFFSVVTYVMKNSENAKTVKTAKLIRAFYEESKASGENPDPELYTHYLDALLPKGKDYNFD